MKILNTDGLVLFGPGSEWLWFMLQFLALATTFYAIYRQLRLQASQGAVEQVEGLNREYDSERMLRYRLAIAVAERDEIAYPLGASRAIVNFWEGLGALVRKGHLDANLYWDSSGSNCQTAWASLEPFVQQSRADTGVPLIGEHFEWLAAKMTSLDHRAGIVIVIDRAYVARLRDRSIAAMEEMLRVEEALRAVVAEGVAQLMDPRIGLVTVTGVRVTSDLAEATVYVSVLGNERVQQSTLTGLTSARGVLQARINRELSLRRTPSLTFSYDETVERAVHMSKLIEDVTAELPELEGPPGDEPF